MCDTFEQVRLPGIINMELEANKLKDTDEACPDNTFHLNIPLQISVDTKSLSSRNIFSPSESKVWRLGKEREDRGRVPDTNQYRSRTPSGRVRSASAGRDKKQDLAARYWAVLFENLRRAVDDLYRTCEGDESCAAAKEVLMVLENYVKDFKNLIGWLKLKTEYENTPLPHRPTSLAWDIRKTSPAGKLTPTGGSGKMTPTRQMILCSPAKRQLNFNDNNENTNRKVSETITEANIECDMSPGDATLVSGDHVVLDSGDHMALASGDNFVLDSGDQINLQAIETDAANISEHEKSDSEQEKDDLDKADTAEKVLLSSKNDNVVETESKIDTKVENSASSPPETPKPNTTPVKAKTNLILERSLKNAQKPKVVEKPKPARAAVTVATKTTFASTLKGASKGVAARSTVHKLTRALTTIAPAAKPAAARRTTAGLLITSQKLQAAATSKPANNRKSEPFRPPMQNRISLVARQSQFVSRGSGGGGVGAPKNTPTRGKPSTQPSAADVANIPISGSNTSLNSCSSSNRSWAQTVKGEEGQLHFSTSMDEVYKKDEVDEEGWCTVRRARSRFSPSNSAAQGLVANREGVRQLNKAKNRFKMPSSAVSMPSLACEDDRRSRSGSGGEERFVRPSIEKSFSSASIVRNKDARVSRLGSVSERTAGGSSVESVSGSDPFTTKKKKDMINHTKKALKKSSDPTSNKPVKTKARKNNSVPLRKEKSDLGLSAPENNETPARQSPEPKQSLEPRQSPISRQSPEPMQSPEHSQDHETDSDTEILERDAAIAKAELEAADLQREIQETEQAELTDTDLETTDTEQTDTDTNDARSDVGTTSDIAETMFESLSWAEQMELEEQMADAAESRYPGRAIHLHEKLSSPARKKEPHETFRHYQEKQDKARIRRQMFGEEKANKLALLNQRIIEVLDQRDRLVDERKGMIEDKLKKAEEKRSQHIEGIRRKAHEEEEKLKEIAFINELQAQNARIDMISQVSTADEKCEERLAEIAGERAKKAEQQAERDARAEERRRAMEAERQKHLDAMIERRREREERIQGCQAAAREKRKVSARQRDRERLERLSTVRAAEKDMKEELQEKIQQKQEDAAKRHAEYLEDIRLKAFELSVQKCSSDEGVPLIKPYQTKKKCEGCNVLIKSEVHLQSHLRGKQHADVISRMMAGKDLSGAEITDYNLKNIIDAPEGEMDPSTIKARERVKAVKKRAKKLKAKMVSKGADYTGAQPPPNKHTDSPNRAKIGKSIRDIEKLLNNQGQGSWPNNAVSSLERALGEICRSFDKNHPKDQEVFFALGGFTMLGKIYDMILESKGANTCAIPMKSLVTAGRVLLKATKGHNGNAEHLLLSNRVSTFVDVLKEQLTRLVPDPGLELDLDIAQGPDTDPLSLSVMQFLSAFILQLTTADLTQTSRTRLQDLVSYIVSIETVDYLSRYFQLVRDPIDSSPEVAECLLVALQFLSSLTGAVETSVADDPTHLLSTLQWTELAGTVSLLYGMLLHQGRDTARESTPPPLPPHTLAVATETCTLLSRLVKQNLCMVQNVLASEGISLEFRHIASYLLWYSQCHNETMLLNQVITLVGYFTANHADNQAIVQAGSQPSVLQQLASLPFQYFSQPELKNVLFPTLLACCHNNVVNTNILTVELSWNLIEDYIKTQDAKDSQLVQMIL